jgi:hypothetical protein
VAAVDIVGNVSTRSAIKTVELHDPSEYEFIEAVYSNYTGAKSALIVTTLDGIKGLFGPMWDLTWQGHFESFGWTTIEQQVNAGYPVYYQPTYLLDGWYNEQFDFGEVRKNIKIVVDYNKYQLSGYTDIRVEIAYSVDNVTWSDWSIGNSVLATEFRYVQIQLFFINQDDKSIVHVSNLTVSLNVILIIDSGVADCLSTDAGGTLITYTKIYTGISSVTAIPSSSLQPLYAVCDEVNKTNFRCLIFDSSGNRSSATINWKSRGVV